MHNLCTTHAQPTPSLVLNLVVQDAQDILDNEQPLQLLPLVTGQLGLLLQGRLVVFILLLGHTCCPGLQLHAAYTTCQVIRPER